MSKMKKAEAAIDALETLVEAREKTTPHADLEKLRADAKAKVAAFRSDKSK